MLKKLTGIIVLFILILVFAFRMDGGKIDLSEEKKIQVQDIQEIPAAPALDNYGMAVQLYEDVFEGRIQRNESLYIILNRHGVSPERIHSIQQHARGVVNLNRMMPGQQYRIYKNDGEATVIVWRRSSTEYTTIKWENGIEISNASIPVKTNIASISGTIQSSLANAIQAQGVSNRLVVDLANIYAWTIDFYGLRQGDQFKAVYENRYVMDEFIGIGRIKAAEFEHRGNVIRAYYYDNGDQPGYYDAEGNSMRRSMMRVPFEYNPRISSGFSHNRLHPILNQRRPHYGTDYAAPTGTPILAAGDGVVTEAQYRGGNGNIVQIRHNSVYRTAYLHMSRFASGIRPGVRVRQGQVIGYVGQTGLATGPHLCYRLYKNNTPINSVTYDFPPDEGLAEQHMPAFLSEVQRLDELLYSLSEPVENLAMY